MISDRVKLIDASQIRAIWSKAASLKDPIDFSIGQPDFDVPGPVKEAAIKAIERGENKYTVTAGDKELREKVAGRVKAEFGWDGEPLITCGVSGGLLLAFTAMVNPGDEVVIIDPYFVIYKHLVRMLGGRCVFVDSYPDFRLPVEGLRRAVSDRTKLILLNSPANPTGAVYSADELQAAAEIAAEKDAVILSDEIYEKFCYDGGFASVGRFYERTLVLRGFSKSYGMPGWRLGYAAAGPVIADVLEEMTKVQQYTFVCAPTPLQKAAVAAMDADMGEAIERYRRRRDMVYEGLRDKFELGRPEGAFYAFVKAPDGRGSEFAERAIDNNVLVIPGKVFSEKDTHFRLSFCTSEDRIEAGIEALRKLV